MNKKVGYSNQIAYRANQNPNLYKMKGVNAISFSLKQDWLLPFKITYN